MHFGAWRGRYQLKTGLYHYLAQIFEGQ